MDHNYLVPFIKSTKTMFETMFQLNVDIGEPRIKQPGDTSHDVSGIIAFSGDFEGAVVLTFPKSTALRVTQIMTGEDLSEKPEDLTDAIGELVNMVAGGAKAQVDGKHIGISCPSVVLGADHTVHNQKDIPCICIPCNCDCGEFTIELSVRENAAANASKAA